MIQACFFTKNNWGEKNKAVKNNVWYLGQTWDTSSVFKNIKIWRKNRGTFDIYTPHIYKYIFYSMLLLACISHVKRSLAWSEMLTRTRDIRGEWNEGKPNIFEEMVLKEMLPAPQLRRHIYQYDMSISFSPWMSGNRQAVNLT